MLGVFALGNLAFTDEIQSVGSQPDLAGMVRVAIQLLQYNRKGYLLVVDCGLAGKAAAQNEGERMLRELIALDQAVASAVSFAGEDSLILVVGKQSVGGLRLNGYPFRDDKGVSVVGINSSGHSLDDLVNRAREPRPRGRARLRRPASPQRCLRLWPLASRKMESSRESDPAPSSFKASRTTPTSIGLFRKTFRKFRILHAP